MASSDAEQAVAADSAVPDSAVNVAMDEEEVTTTHSAVPVADCFVPSNEDGVPIILLEVFSRLEGHEGFLVTTSLSGVCVAFRRAVELEVKNKFETSIDWNTLDRGRTELPRLHEKKLHNVPTHFDDCLLATMDSLRAGLALQAVSKLPDADPNETYRSRWSFTPAEKKRLSTMVKTQEARRQNFVPTLPMRALIAYCPNVARVLPRTWPLHCLVAMAKIYKVAARRTAAGGTERLGGLPASRMPEKLAVAAADSCPGMQLHPSYVRERDNSALVAAGRDPFREELLLRLLKHWRDEHPSETGPVPADVLHKCTAERSTAIWMKSLNLLPRLWKPAALESEDGAHVLKAATGALELLSRCEKAGEAATRKVRLEARMIDIWEKEIASLLTDYSKRSIVEAFIKFRAESKRDHAQAEAAAEEADASLQEAVAGASAALLAVEAVATTTPRTPNDDGSSSPSAEEGEATASGGGGTAQQTSSVITVASVLRVRKMMVDLEDKPSHAAYLHVKPEYAWLGSTPFGSRLTAKVVAVMGWTEQDTQQYREEARAAREEAQRVREEAQQRSTQQRADRKRPSLGLSAEQLKMPRMESFFRPRQ